jgi:dihydroxyacetone kinase
MDSPPSVVAAAAAFASGCAAMMHYGGASRGNRTMLDALIPAAEAIDRVALAGGTMAAALAAAADAAEAGAEATRTMSAGAGRASYVPQETIAAVPDPGAKGVAFWLRALAMSADEPSLRLSAAGSE